jgi:hypothetical protein
MLIAQYYGHPQIIYVAAQAVYVTTDVGYVGRARKDGSDLKPVAMPGFASSAFVGTLVAEDGDRVFFVRAPAGTIQLSYCLTTGCDSTAMPIGGQYAQYFAVDQQNHKIIWVDYTPSRLVSASTSGAVSGVDLPGGMLASGSSGSRLLYAQGGVYYADGSSVYRIPVAGGSIATITNASARLTILGANSSTLFVYDGDAIGTVPLPSGDGRSPKVLVAATVTENVDGRFAADDRSIYWVSEDDVDTCELSNCAGTRKSLPKRPADRFDDVGIDAAAVYLLANSGDATPAASTVWRLAR